MKSLFATHSVSRCSGNGRALLKPNPWLFFSCRLAEAFRLVKHASKSGAALGPACYDHVIRSLLAEGSMEDAMAAKSM